MFKKLSLSSVFAKNVLTLMTGTVISQAIPVALSPVLTRIYTPDDFGVFALYFSITTIICVFVTGKYEMTIMLPEKDKDALNLVALSLIITTAISVLTLIIILFFQQEIAALLNNNKIAPYLYFIPVSIFFIGIYQSFNYWSNRAGYFKSIAVSRISRSVNTTGVSIILGYTSFKNVGLILSDTLGQAVSCVVLIYNSFKNNKIKINDITKADMILQATRYKQFPKFNIISSLFGKASNHLPVLLLSSFYGSAIVGFFALSQRVISAPGAIIANSIGDVFRQKASIEYREQGHCKHTFNKMFKTLFFISLLPFVLFFVFAPNIFVLIFGKEWLLAGTYAQIMAVMFFLQFIVSPLSNMFLVAEKQKYDLILQFGLLIAVVISLIAGYNFFKQPKIVILFFSLTYSLKYLVELYLSYQFSRGKTS